MNMIFLNRYFGMMGVLCFTFINFYVLGCVQSQTQEQLRMNYLAQHPHLSEQKKEAISNQAILDGMTQEEVLASWGYPGRGITKHYYRGLSTETWHYEFQILNFENGILTGWTEY